mgnify:CR=1 FL=1
MPPSDFSELAELERIIEEGASHLEARTVCEVAAGERRFPVLSSLSASWESALKEIALDPAMSLRPPKDFEGDAFLLQAKIAGFEDFRRIVLHLSGQLDENADRLREIFDPQWSE